jgi:hypothetical protein
LERRGRDWLSVGPLLSVNMLKNFEPKLRKGPIGPNRLKNLKIFMHHGNSSRSRIQQLCSFLGSDLPFNRYSQELLFQ